MKFGSIVILTILAILAVIGFAAADRLPNQTPENQVFSIDTVIDATGAVDTGTNMIWVISTPGEIPAGNHANHVDGFGTTLFLYPQVKVLLILSIVTPYLSAVENWQKLEL